MNANHAKNVTTATTRPRLPTWRSLAAALSVTLLLPIGASAQTVDLPLGGGTEAGEHPPLLEVSRAGFRSDGGRLVPIGAARFAGRLLSAFERDSQGLSVHFPDDRSVRFRKVERSADGASTLRATNVLDDLRINGDGSVAFRGKLFGPHRALTGLDSLPKVDRLKALLAEIEVLDERLRALEAGGTSSRTEEAERAEDAGSIDSDSDTDRVSGVGLVGALRGEDATPAGETTAQQEGRALEGDLSRVVRDGAVVQRGDTGTAVHELQRRLEKLGIATPVTGTFDEGTERALKAFQSKRGVHQTGKVGATTLSHLKDAAGPNLGSSTAAGRSLANKARAIANTHNTTGRCYARVADAVDATIGRFLSGGSAWMAAGQLARHPRFKEVSVSGAALRKLPAGAIVVWRQTGRSPHGHISVALGDGREASDHVDIQRLSLRGDSRPRVFLPR